MSGRGSKGREAKDEERDLGIREIFKVRCQKGLSNLEAEWRLNRD